MTLTWLDYTVIAGYLVAITIFGSWFARFQKTTRNYFLNDRSVPWWAICFTIVATETSTLSFIGVPAQAFAGNMTFLQLAMGYVIGRLLVSLLFIPAYFRGDLFTSYELLQRRFGPGVKNVAAVIFVITRTLADGVRLFATALVITVVTQVPVTLAIVIIGVAMIVYTTRGGVSAVIWTDVVQMFIYVAGALVVLASLLQQIDGGWPAVVAAGEAAAKFRVLDLTLDPLRVYTLWAGLFGGIALTLATHGTDQYLVQRLLSAKSAKSAATGLILSGFIVFAQFTLFLIIGIALYTFYQQTPLPRPARDQRRSASALRRHIALPRRRRLHRGRDRGGCPVAVNQRARRDDRQRLLSEVCAARRRPGDADAGVEGGDDLLGRGTDRRRYRRAVDSIGARHRPRGIVARGRPGPRRVSGRCSDRARRHASDDDRDDRRRCRAGVGLGDWRNRLDVVRVHRLVGDFARRPRRITIHCRTRSRPP